MRYTSAAVTNPVTITPRTVSIGFLAGPVVPTSALISSSAMITSSTTAQRPRCPPAGSVKWDAAPMKNSIGNESTTLVREARNGRRGICLATARGGDGVGDHNSLIRPDHAPDVGEHHRAERRTGEDGETPGIAPAGAPQSQDDHTGQEREGRAPTEPPQRARHELLRRAALGRGVRLRHERPLNEVEVVEETDPGDAGEEMNPAEQKLDSRVGEQRHRAPPSKGPRRRRDLPVREDIGASIGIKREPSSRVAG